MTDESTCVELALYRVTRPIITYVAAQTPAIAISIADDEWEAGGLNDQRECDWGSSDDVVVHLVPDDGERIDGGVYNDRRFVVDDVFIGSRRTWLGRRPNDEQQALIDEARRIRARLGDIEAELQKR